MYHCVYKISNIKMLKYYIGKHSGVLPSSEDIGFKYFSCSTDSEFKKDQEKNPNHYKYEILGQFTTSTLAIDYEIWLHNRHNVGVNPSYYNKAKQTSNGFDTTGIKNSKETIERKRISGLAAHKKIKNDKNLYEIRSQAIKNGLERAYNTKNKMQKHSKNLSIGVKKYYNELKKDSQKIKNLSKIRKKANKLINDDPIKKANKSKKVSESNSGIKHPLSKPVAQVDKDTHQIIKIWDFAAAAANLDGVRVSGISNCINGLYWTSAGFKWCPVI